MKPYFAKRKTPCGCTETGFLVVPTIEKATYHAECPVCGFLWDFTVTHKKEEDQP